MYNDIEIIGENGSKLKIINIVPEGGDFSADVYLKTDWFEVKVNFTSSFDRLVEFSSEIDKILSKENNRANFINEDGNFDLDLIYNTSTGTIQLKGILIKNMMDDSRVEYSMESDFNNLIKLQECLRILISRNNK